MWICLNNAFLSIVENPKYKDRLLVRARREGDIESVFPGVKVSKTPNRDYLYRASIKRDIVARTISEKITFIDYGNFKDSVNDPTLHDLYERVWWIMRRLQNVFL